MTTTALTFRSRRRRRRRNTADECGEDKTSAAPLQTADPREKSTPGSAIRKIASADAGSGIFLGDKLLLWPLPVWRWLWRAVAVEKITGNQLFARVIAGGDVRLLFPVEQLLLKT